MPTRPAGRCSRRWRAKAGHRWYLWVTRSPSVVHYRIGAGAGRRRAAGALQQIGAGAVARVSRLRPLQRLQEVGEGDAKHRPGPLLGAPAPRLPRSRQPVARTERLDARMGRRHRRPLRIEQVALDPLGGRAAAGSTIGGVPPPPPGLAGGPVADKGAPRGLPGGRPARRATVGVGQPRQPLVGPDRVRQATAGANGQQRRGAQPAQRGDRAQALLRLRRRVERRVGGAAVHGAVCGG